MQGQCVRLGICIGRALPPPPFTCDAKLTSAQAQRGPVVNRVPGRDCFRRSTARLLPCSFDSQNDHYSLPILAVFPTLSSTCLTSTLIALPRSLSAYSPCETLYLGHSLRHRFGCRQRTQIPHPHGLWSLRTFVRRQFTLASIHRPAKDLMILDLSLKLVSRTVKPSRKDGKAEFGEGQTAVLMQMELPQQTTLQERHVSRETAEGE